MPKLLNSPQPHSRRMRGKPIAAASVTNVRTPPLISSAAGAPNAPAMPPTPRWPTGATPMLSTHEPMALPRCSLVTLDCISILYKVSTADAQAFIKVKMIKKIHREDAQ